MYPDGDAGVAERRCAPQHARGVAAVNTFGELSTVCTCVNGRAAREEDQRGGEDRRGDGTGIASLH